MSVATQIKLKFRLSVSREKPEDSLGRYRMESWYTVTVYWPLNEVIFYPLDLSWSKKSSSRGEMFRDIFSSQVLLWWGEIALHLLDWSPGTHLRSQIWLSLPRTSALLGREVEIRISRACLPAAWCELPAEWEALLPVLDWSSLLTSISSFSHTRVRHTHRPPTLHTKD